MRLPRLTTRRLMALVVVVAVSIPAGRGASALKRASDAYRVRATQCGSIEAMLRGFAARIRRKASKQRADAALLRRYQLPDDMDPKIRAVRLALERCALAMYLLHPDNTAPLESLRETYHEWAASCERSAGWSDRAAQEHDRRSKYYAELRNKYERAARYPWLPVPPDPPEPENDNPSGSPWRP